MPNLGSGLSFGSFNKIPGYDYDASSFIVQAGIENSATIPLYGDNSLPSSNNFTDTSVWYTDLGTFTPNAHPNPFSTANDATLFANKAVSYGTLLRLQSTHVERFLANGRRFLLSIYAKAGASNLLGFRIAESGGNSGNNYSFVNLSNGSTTLLTPTNGTNHLLTATSVGNGWYRCAYSFTNATSSNTIVDFSVCDSNGNVQANLTAGTRSVYIWGAQLELTSNTIPSAYAETGSNSTLLQEAQLRTYGTLLSEVVNPQKLVNDFVVGSKALGLFNSLVCWPTRSFLNAPSGNTMYSLGGLGQYDGTFTGTTPTRRLSGLQASSTNSYLQTTYPFNLSLTYTGISIGNIVEGINKRIFGSSTPTNLVEGSYSANTGYKLYDNTNIISVSHTSSAFTFPTFKPMYYTTAKVSNLFTSYQYGSTTPDQVTITGLSNNAYNLAYFGSSGTSLGGIYPFMCIINNVVLSAGQSSAFYALYKSTLGYGTFLP